MFSQNEEIFKKLFAKFCSKVKKFLGKRNFKFLIKNLSVS